jgi:integrase
MSDKIISNIFDQITIHHNNIVEFRGQTFKIVDGKYLEVGHRLHKIPEPRIKGRSKKYFVDIQLTKRNGRRNRIYKYFDSYEDAKNFAIKAIILRELIPPSELDDIKKSEIAPIKVSDNPQSDDNYLEALNFLRDLEKGIIIRPEGLKLSEGFKLYEEYLYSRKRNKAKVKEFQYFVKPFLEKWGDIEFSKLTKNHIEDYIAKRTRDVHKRTGQPISESTIKSELSRLSTAWNFLIRTGYVDGVNYADIVLKERRLKDRIRERALSYEEIFTLLKEIIFNLPKGPRWNEKKAFILIGLFTGARKEEVLRLRKEHIRIARDQTGYYGMINFTSDITKTGKTRKIDIPYEFAMWLLQNCGNDKILFPSFQNSYQKRMLTEWFQRFLKKCHIENFYYHDFRHTWATIASELGFSDRIIALLGGWKSVYSVSRYITLRREYSQNPMNHFIYGMLQDITRQEIEEEKIIPLPEVETKSEGEAEKKKRKRGKVPKIEKVGRKYRIREHKGGKWTIHVFNTYEEALAFQKELEKALEKEKEK